MYRVLLWITLLAMSAAGNADGDIWQNLFKQKLGEALRGDAEAQFDVGTMYQKGRGVTADRARAVEWYVKSADQGNSRALSRLHLMEANQARFEKTLAQAEQGDLGSMHEVGEMYMYGTGVSADYAQAVKYLQLAAESGNAKSAYKLGLIHSNGKLTKVSNSSAFRWFRLAAEGGYPAAQFQLGKLYSEGRGVQQDQQQALSWFSKAVDNGFDQARGMMIDAAEKIEMQAAREQAADNRAVPEKVVVKPKPEKQQVVKEPVEKTAAQSPGYAIEDLMLASWYRGEEPVNYLPSAISTCRVEEDRIVCFSDDQTREAGGNRIKFKTKSIISSFTHKGDFEVTYRNLVIDASPIERAQDDDDSVNESAPGSNYRIKTGWSNPHRLECSFNNLGTLSCKKNSSLNLVLTSPQTLAGGR